jgi:hypothetical protein
MAAKKLQTDRYRPQQTIRAYRKHRVSMPIPTPPSLPGGVDAVLRQRHTPRLAIAFFMVNMTSSLLEYQM